MANFGGVFLGGMARALQQGQQLDLQHQEATNRGSLLAAQMDHMASQDRMYDAHADMYRSRSGDADILSKLPPGFLNFDGDPASPAAPPGSPGVNTSDASDGAPADATGLDPTVKTTIDKAIADNGLPPSAAPIIYKVAQAESGGQQIDPKTGQTLTSPKGALGVMQLMPDTAASLGVDPNDQTQNIQGGVKYLAQLWQKYKDPVLTLAAYNAGPGNVDKAGGVPNFPETKNYIAKILGSPASSSPATADTSSPPQAAPDSAPPATSGIPLPGGSFELAANGGTMSDGGNGLISPVAQTGGSPSSGMDALQQQFNNKINQINSIPGLSQAGRTALVNELTKAYNAKRQSLGAAAREAQTNARLNQQDARESRNSANQEYKRVIDSGITEYGVDAQGRGYAHTPAGIVPMPGVNASNVDSLNSGLNAKAQQQADTSARQNSEGQIQFTNNLLNPAYQEIAGITGMKYNPQEKAIDSGWSVDPEVKVAGGQNNIAKATALRAAVQELAKRGVYMDPRDAGDLVSSLGDQFDSLQKPQEAQVDMDGKPIMKNGQPVMGPAAITNPDQFYRANKDKFLGGAVYNYVLDKTGDRNAAASALNPKEQLALFGSPDAKVAASTNDNQPKSAGEFMGRSIPPQTSGLPVGTGAVQDDQGGGLGLQPPPVPAPAAQEPSQTSDLPPNDAGMKGVNVTVSDPGQYDPGYLKDKQANEDQNAAFVKGVKDNLVTPVSQGIDSFRSYLGQLRSPQVQGDIAQSADASERLLSQGNDDRAKQQEAENFRNVSSMYQQASPRDRAIMDAQFARKNRGVTLGQLLDWASRRMDNTTDASINQQ